MHVIPRISYKLCLVRRRETFSPECQEALCLAYLDACRIGRMPNVRPLAALDICTSGPEVKYFFPNSTQLSMKFILLINIEMPTFVNMVNTIS